MYKNKKAFTLIELIAVLIILSIIVLIAVPIVLIIKNKVKLNAYKRSIDAYGRSIEYAIANSLIDKGTLPTDLSTLKIEYTGYEVNCNIMQIKENGGVYLSECTVNGKEIKDKKTEDGWYHYNERDLTNEYVDMYGDALKKASLAYYNTNGSPVEDYTTLTIDYKGKPVTCEVTVNYDGTIYMTKCKVNSVDVTSDTEDGYYHYGNSKPNKPYSIGDEVTYNEMKFYVIRESNANSEIVTLLKSEPLTTDEVNTYGGVGTTNNHVNVYLPNNEVNKYNYQIAYNLGGYGGMVYYTSSSCGYYPNSWVYNSCTTDYSRSEIKYVIDAWVDDKFLDFELIEDDNGYKARLITIEELKNNLGYGNSNTINENVPSWVSQYRYWTMSERTNTDQVWAVANNIEYHYVWGSLLLVRPVITIKKSAIN